MFLSVHLCYHGCMITPLLRLIAPTAATRAPGIEPLIGLAVLTAVAGLWLAFWTLYFAFGTDVVVTVAALAVALLAARVQECRNRRAAAADWRAGFIPSARPAVAVLLAGPEATAKRWAAAGLFAPHTVAVRPVPGGLAATLHLRPGQTVADIARAADELAYQFGMAAVTVSGRGARVTLTMYPYPPR